MKRVGGLGAGGLEGGERTAGVKRTNKIRTRARAHCKHRLGGGQTAAELAVVPNPIRPVVLGVCGPSSNNT